MESSCDCAEGYEGEFCEIDINYCDIDRFPNAECLNGGICIDNPTSHFCDCSLINFSGPRCENDEFCLPNNPCNNDQPCANGACICGSVAPVTNGNVTIEEGFVTGGTLCEEKNYCIDIDGNSSSVCGDNGSCSSIVRDDGSDYFECLCQSGWYGSRCEIDVASVCRNRDNFCGDHGECVAVRNNTAANEEYVPSCDCDFGYEGDNCEIAPNPGQDPDYCYRVDPLDNNNCIIKNLCNDPDVNTCNANNSDCHNRADEDADSVLCICHEGYYGDSCELSSDQICNDVDCGDKGTCAVIGNPIDGFDKKCVCETGYEGEFCRIDTFCNKNLCQNGMTCSDGACNCGSNSEFQTTGDYCEIRDYCGVNDPCENNSVCVNEGNGSICTCEPGYYGERCEFEINSHCTNVTCSGQGFCSVRPATAQELALDAQDIYVHQCNCDYGYSGNDCETDIFCEANLCANNQPCSERACNCGSAFDATGNFITSGVNCEIRDYCILNNPCGDFGTCINSLAGSVCVCELGWSGEDCTDKVNTEIIEPDTFINPCDSTNCGNNGVCVLVNNNGNSYTSSCHCNNGYSGSNCQIDTFCSNNPCRNNQPCVNGRCDCGRIFSGALTSGLTCDIIDYCSASGINCGNGYCANNYEEFSTSGVSKGAVCVCNSGWSGVNCNTQVNPSTFVNPCDSTNCGNNGFCVLVNNGIGGYSSRCQCNYGYSGSNCNIADSCLLNNPCHSRNTEINGCSSVQSTLNTNVFNTGTAQCRCKNGYEGQFCDIDPCNVQSTRNTCNPLTSEINYCRIDFTTMRGICPCKQGVTAGTSGCVQLYTADPVVQTCQVSNCATCKNNNPLICEVCSSLYHLVEGSNEGFIEGSSACARNVCKCKNGKANVGSTCTIHGASTCSVCDEFYILNEQKRTCQLPTEIVEAPIQLLTTYPWEQDLADPNSQAYKTFMITKFPAIHNQIIQGFGEEFLADYTSDQKEAVILRPASPIRNGRKKRQASNNSIVEIIYGITVAYDEDQYRTDREILAEINSIVTKKSNESGNINRYILADIEDLDHVSRNDAAEIVGEDLDDDTSTFTPEKPSIVFTSSSHIREYRENEEELREDSSSSEVVKMGLTVVMMIVGAFL